MKGREDDRRLLFREIELNIYSIKASNIINKEQLCKEFQSEFNSSYLESFIKLFANATTQGSLIKIPIHIEAKLAEFKKTFLNFKASLLTLKVKRHLELLIKQAEILSINIIM